MSFHSVFWFQLHAGQNGGQHLYRNAWYLVDCCHLGPCLEVLRSYLHDKEVLNV